MVPRSMNPRTLFLLEMPSVTKPEGDLIAGEERTSSLKVERSPGKPGEGAEVMRD